MTRRLAVVLFLSAGVLRAGTGTPADPDPNRFAQEIKAFAESDSRNAIPAQPVLFVGSSSIRLWRTHESFPALPVLNRGFGGSHISDVLHFADRVVLPYQPQVIVFYAGGNDIAAGKSASRVFEDYRRFVGLVQAKLSRTHIVFLALNPSRSRWSYWPEMQKANGLIREFCQGDSRLVFADFSGLFLGADSLPNSDLFQSDRLHLNAQGYAVWTKALGPVLHKVVVAAKSTGAK